MNILISGFGNMGSRHAQSLLSSKKNYSIYVIEPSKKAVYTGLKNIGYSISDIKLIKNIDELDSQIDLAISTTCSKPRFEIISKLIKSGVKLFLVEKVVFQSLYQFDKIIDLLGKNNAKGFCNFPRRYFENYNSLIPIYRKSNYSMEMNIYGGNNWIGCNGIHFMDLFEYITESKISKISYSLNEDLSLNKRGREYRDVNGLVYLENKNKDILKIYFDPTYRAGITETYTFNNNQFLFSARDKKEYQIIDHNITSIEYKILQTSKLTSLLIEDIFKDNSKLPSIKQTRNTHKNLFEMIMKTLQLNFDKNSICPIT